MAQPFQNYKQQISKLKNEKQLNITDEVYAENVLKHIGYYALVSGYKDLFKNKETHKYIDGARFEDIVALYCFDEDLRELFLRYLLKIERHFRSLISYSFTEKYGETQSCYLDKNNYNYSRANQSGVDRLIDVFYKLANDNSNYTYINYNRNTYNNVPLWVLVNAVSFGTLSKFYSFSQHDIQSKISHEFPMLNERELRQILAVITKYRNVCAHGERLFSYMTKNDIPDLQLHNKLNIPKINNQYKYGKHDLFAVVISFRYLLEHDDFIAFKQRLSKIIQNLLSTTDLISEEHLYTKMGFPKNWKKITLYRKIQ